MHFLESCQQFQTRHGAKVRDRDVRPPTGHGAHRPAPRPTYDVSQHVVVHVEVGRVRRAAHVRNVRCLEVPYSFPIQALEKRVLLEVLNPVLAQPALPAADQPLDEIFRFLRHIRDVGRELKSLLGKRGDPWTRGENPQKKLPSTDIAGNQAEAGPPKQQSLLFHSI